MNSVAIGGKKQVPGAVHKLDRKTHSNKKSTRKVPPPKQQKPAQTNEQYVPKDVRTNKLFTEHQPYTPLPTISFARKSANTLGNIIPIYKDNQLCTTRAAVATFIIIVILIAAAGISIGVVFGAINSKNSSGSGNNNTNQYSVATPASGLLTSSVSIGSQTGSPCSAYTTINDPSRNYALAGSSSACDNGPLFNTSSGAAWIRFVGTGGTTITSSTPGLGYCGAFLPGWYNGTLPLATNVMVSGVICFETASFPCGFNVAVSIIRCTGNYYIYLLPPISICNARYCTA